MNIECKFINTDYKKENYSSRRKIANNLVFRGELELKFFKAVKESNLKDQISILNNIKFDVLEKDIITGDNFLHAVCRDGTQSLLDKSLKLLRMNKSKIIEVINATNNDKKVPFDYLKNEGFKESVRSLIGNGQGERVIVETTNVTDDVVNIIKTDNLVTNPIKIIDENLKVGNEITSPIDISNISFEISDETAINPFVVSGNDNDLRKLKGLDAVVGMDFAKKILNDEIVKPLNNNKNVFVNGFLLHGFGRNGKTYLVEKLAEFLNRNIVDASTIISAMSDISKQESSDIQKLIDKSIIKINTRNPREIIEVSEIFKENFNKTRKQGIAFMDEIGEFFSADNSYDFNKLQAMQSIENSAKKGMILIATTNNFDKLDSNLVNSLRFERPIEVKPPKKEDILELIKKNLNPEAELNDKEISDLSKRMNGLSFNDVTRIVERTCDKNEKSTFQNFIDEMTDYVQIHKIKDITEEGTTSNYDIFYIRTLSSINDPKSLDDVIGMKDVKKKLKEVFWPLKNEAIFEKYNKENEITKPNGVLLYGPPGCGKTFIMKALSADTKLPIYIIDFSDVGSSFMNETDQNIKRLFDQLRKKYKETGEASILFFDECDSLFAKNGDKENTKTLNTLKNQMNNAGNDGIFVVAATNEKDSLNAAITRDGRFDQKIEVGYPDEEARIGLISKALNVPILKGVKTDANIQEFAKLTDGLSNASINTIFSNLKYSKQLETINKNIKTQDELNEYFNSHPIDYKSIKESIVAKKEETNKMKLKQRKTTGLEWQQKTSAYDEDLSRVYYNENDPKSLDDVVGMDSVKDDMKLKVLAPLNPILKKLLEENEIPISNGIIMHGPGGCGKTFIVKAAAAESKIPLYELNLNEQGSGFMNETAANITKIFKQLAKKYRETEEPSILFLDECNSLLSKVKNTGTDVSADRTNILNTLKIELANAVNNGIRVIAATNEYKTLDPNVIRSGRFDDHIPVGYPDVKARLALIIKLLGSKQSSKALIEQKEGIQKIVELTNGMSNADIKTVVDNAIILSSKDFVNKIIRAFKADSLIDLEGVKTKDLTFADLENSALKKIEELKEIRKQDNAGFEDLAGGFYENK